MNVTGVCLAERLPLTCPRMRWLMYGNLTQAAIDALKRHGHEPRLPADLGIAPDATPDQVLEAARKAQLEILTTDPALAHAPFEEFTRFVRTLVLLNVEPGDVEQDEAIDRLFARYNRLAPGRIYTVTDSRVKARQLPGRNC
jgi:hypothetical protein